MNFGKLFCGAAVVGTLAFAGVAQASGVNIVVNGSFENPVIGNGEYIFTDDLWGWKIIGDRNVEVRNNVVGTAYDGDNYVELDSDIGNVGIFQTLTTVIGQAYQLTFAYSPRMNQLPDTNPIAVTWNDHALPGSPYTGDGTGATDNNWVIYSFIIPSDWVTSTESILQFTAVGNSDTLGGGLDAVSVSAVPLPGAALLFGSALLGVGALRKRKAANETGADELAA